MVAKDSSQIIVESISVSVRCRTNSTIQLIITVDRDRNVTLTSRRWKGNGEVVDYSYPPLPPKRWWGEHIADVHPADRNALHQFLGLSDSPTKKANQ